jgi:uncharacterized protein with von Willebrand factor type A (vWA) domain
MEGPIILSKRNIILLNSLEVKVNFYSSDWDFGLMGKRKVLVVNTKPEKIDPKKVAEQFHHIHVIDTSGSMSSNMKDLIETLKWVVSKMPNEDYVSLIQFSGNGCHKVLIKGAKKDEKSLISIIDSLFSGGCTCFSEPMQTVETIINDLSKICNNFSVTLFTDGCPVVPWADEIDRTLSAVEKYSNKVVAVNTIGYGNYYDQDFLKRISAKSPLGIFTHSSKIKDYESIFEDNYDSIKGMIKDPINIKSDKGIIYINNKVTIFRDNEIDLKSIDKTKNQFVIISENTNDFIFYFISKCKKLIDIEIFFTNEIFIF